MKKPGQYLSHAFPILRPMAVVFCLVLFAGCRDKNKDPEPDLKFENGILVLNEGNFQGGNASMSFLKRGESAAQNNIFSIVNGRPLGDVAQSATIAEGRLWVVVNNSGKIESLSLPQLKSQCVITALQSPRYFLPVSASKAYVTDLYANAISIVDIANCRVSGTIAVGAWTERMLMNAGRVYVAQTGTDKVLLIDPISDMLIDSIYVGREPNSLAVDKNGKLWVLCSGGINQVFPRLSRINLQTNSPEAFWEFPNLQSSPSNLIINGDRDALYFINESIFRMAVTDTGLPQQDLVPAAGRRFNSLAIDPTDGTLFATDADDYQRNGWLIRAWSNGNNGGAWQVGVIPGHIVFLP